MTNKMSLFVAVVAVLGVTPVWSATNTGMRGASSADLTGGPAARQKPSNVNYEKYETRSSTKTYTQKDGNNIYYTQPAKRSDLYKAYASQPGDKVTTQQTVRTVRSETVRTEAKRKYYLAHPFFQPLKGKFGSVTDLSYTANSYKVATNFDLSLSPTLGNDTGKWDMTQFTIKEDLSYGITDRIAILGMVRYDASDYAFDWDNSPDDKMDDSGINLYGLGAQWRFADNSEWIATLSGYYQRQTDVANTFILDIKGGYKVGSSTIYGLARAWYVLFDDNSYGNGISNGDEHMFLAYNVGDDTSVYFEGGLGVFSVLHEDWTLNLEAVFGNYDWHNQAALKGAIGWQPGNMFALNLYAKMALFDSADGKDLDFYSISPTQGWTEWKNIGTAKIDDYSEWSIGLQAILYF